MREYTRFLSELRENINIAVSIQATAEDFHGDPVRDVCTEERRQQLVSWIDWYTVLVSVYATMEEGAACRAQLDTLENVHEHYRGVMEGRYESGEQCFWFCSCPEVPCEHMLQP
jgi:hypothetical protein